jgi:hypothetical protein
MWHHFGIARKLPLVDDCPDYCNQYKYHHDETNQAQHVNDSELGRGFDDVSLDQ